MPGNRIFSFTSSPVTIILQIASLYIHSHAKNMSDWVILPIWHGQQEMGNFTDECAASFQVLSSM